MYLDSERKVETKTVPSNNNKGISSGVRVITIFPSNTQDRDHKINRISTAMTRTINLGVSKNSVVKEVKTKGVKTVTATRIAKITLFNKADKLFRIFLTQIYSKF